MAVSNEYLGLLDYVAATTVFIGTEKEVLLSDLQVSWYDLQGLWLGCGKRDTITETLIDIADITYSLLDEMTDTDYYSYITAAKELHEKKNAGYSPEENDSWRNFRECEQFGISTADGCLVRLCDKYRRFWSIYNNPDNEKVGERVSDTLMDLAAYSLILVCLLEENT